MEDTIEYIGSYNIYHDFILKGSKKPPKLFYDEAYRIILHFKGQDWYIYAKEIELITNDKNQFEYVNYLVQSGFANSDSMEKMKFENDYPILADIDVVPQSEAFSKPEIKK